MYGTTVIYPLSAAPEKYRYLIELNPMTGIIEAFRFAFLGQGHLTVYSLMYSGLFAVVVALIGTVIFNKTERSFVDTI
jgi:lipopolysaccharide transport system permease protein